MNIKKLFHSAGRHCAAGLTIGLLTLLAPPARAQVVPTTIITLSNMPAYLAPGQITNFFTPGTTPAQNIISLRQGQGFAAAANFLPFASGNITNLGFSINWAASLDGTNYFTPTNWLQLTNSITVANGTTNTNLVVCLGTNYASTQINNMLYVTPLNMQNAGTNAITNANGINVVVSFGNIVPGGYP